MIFFGYGTFQIEWSFVVLVFWCCPGSLGCISPSLSLRVPGLQSPLVLLLVLIPQIHSILISRSFFGYFSEVSFGMVRWMSRQLFSFLSLKMSGLLVLISKPVCINMSHNIVTSSLSVTAWGSCLYHFSFVLRWNFYRIFQCRYVASLLCLYRY